MTRLQSLLIGLAVLVFSHALAAQENALQGVDVSSLPGNKVQITLNMAEPAEKPLSFTIDNPARIALDLPNTTNQLGSKSRNIGVGLAKSLTAIEAQGRTRVVLNLVESAPYDLKSEGNRIVLTIGAGDAAASHTAATGNSPAPAATANRGSRIENVDFRRGPDGEGRVMIHLSTPNIPIDMRQEAGKVVLDIQNTLLPESLERRLDVVDFATPVQTIDTRSQGGNVRVTIAPQGEYEHIAYQSDELFTVEVREVSKEEQEQRQREEVGYTGERLSLNFQDIEVRSVLQLIADFTSTNIVVSDTVSGNITLRLQNVPWDQALDIVLKTKGLAMRKNDDVILVAPSEELAAREKLELESQKQIEELAPLFSEFIQVNYAKAGELASLLSGEGGQGDSSLLSERGSVTIDQRTNTLLIKDTAERLEDIRRLITSLDIPVRQVMIESRIVIANDDFARDLGVKLGLTKNDVFQNETRGIIGGGLPGDLAPPGGVVGIENPAGSGNEALMVDLPVGDPAGALNLLVGRVGRDLLRLELSAMQAEGRGEVLSNPRVITSNQHEATIQQGVEIPYQEASSSGATSVSFKEAVLELKVTPQITPDDRIIMDLAVSKDSVGQVFAGVPSINTRNVSTQVLVDNGDTVVLGGIYEQTQLNEVDKVPFFGDLPGVGVLFRQTRRQDDKTELLIFVTPKIIKQSLRVN
ncbi:type IV pilus secretin PilQ [Thiohalobacter thiocyanaticus]|uniref:Type IV pilus secretin PilQ n=2 Tax=Thiohalobacter thiocyanaticus TaxID=585455 RepID=A0A426QMV8_9GAMM|nr:type IV pilus secretin PilQ [Thiohalobacter thiocyanaticus]